MNSTGSRQADQQPAKQGPVPGIATLPTSGFFDASPIATFVIDASHVVTHFNHACEITLQVNAADVIGTKGLGRVFYGHDRPVMADLVVDGCLEENLEQLYGTHCRRSTVIPGAYEAEDFFAALGDGGRWLSFTAAPLRGPDGRIVGAIETLQDISGRKRIEVALLKTQEALNAKLSMARDQLVQSEKLASIGQLAAGVAHEINNPIGYIFSNFGTLEKYLEKLFRMLAAYDAIEHHVAGTPAGADIAALKSQIELGFLLEDIPALMRESREGIVRVRKIVQDLKDFSHVDSDPQWQMADLTQAIDSTLNVVNNEIKYRADVVKQYQPLPPVQCLVSELNQVIMNLVVNAAQAIGPERGRITIRTGAANGEVWIEISDNGAGISNENLPRIFDPFFTTKAIGKGTGLGLSLSYGIVQKHQGRIEVSSTVGLGSTFRVCLPVLQTGAQTETPVGAQ